MNIARIHQFSFATSIGSGVTNSLFYTQKILRELGFVSDIYSTSIAPELSTEIQEANALKADPEALILVHHCLGYDDTEWLWALPNPKIMVYHNITPPELLPANSEIAHYAALGREQLAQWNTKFIGAIGDSALNTAELKHNAYLNPVTIPMLVDLEKHVATRLSPEVSNQWAHLQDSFNVLFVGRICENKNQAELIEVLAHLRGISGQRVRLILAGETTSGAYEEFLRREVERWGLDEQVEFTGKLSDESLLALYRQSDVFLCLSKHEGFGMPLIEAMQCGLPVLARESSSVADTLGGAGWLFEADRHPYHIAAGISTLMTESSLRRSLLAAQKKRLQQFSKDQIKRRLADYLAELNIDTPAPIIENASAASEVWQVEGPFDSSYSLAIVNRELARALHYEGIDVVLRSHEGAGDFAPNPDFLESDPLTAKLHASAAAKLASDRIPDVALRFCYPPYANDMPAGLRVMHSYGWEETGFPLKYVDEFNRRLDLVTVLSESVAKILRDNGVRVPIVVTGAGVDHLLQNKADIPVELPADLASQLRGFCFLHVSSSFPRKGIDVLLRAYEQAFTSKDEVTLLIKTFPNPHNKVAEILETRRQSNPDFPHVVLINEDWPQKNMLSLYQRSHAFVAPSRGEGFGLPMAEAMLFQLPVITTAWGGQLDFCNEQTAWLCDYKFVKADTHLGLTHSLWAEPDLDDLSAKLKQVYLSNRASYKHKLDAAKNNVELHFTWQKTAQKLISAVSLAQQKKSLSQLPKIAWISTWNARCGIANYSHFLTQALPQDRLMILANHIPERMDVDQSNVLRCWNAEQEENFEYAFQHIVENGIKAVVLQYNFGFASLENLRSFLEQLHANDIKVYVFFHSTANVKIDGLEVSLETIRDHLSLTAGLFVHSVEDVNRLKGWGLLDNVVYFPHGVAAPKLNQVEKLKAFANKKTIASYGFLLPHKGIGSLIEAFARLDHAQEDYQLLLLNSLYPNPISEEEYKRCDELISRLGLAKKVKFITEFLSDEETLSLLRNADLIVFPYQKTQESSSAAVRVGLASGRPVAVTPLDIFDDVREAVHVLDGLDSVSIADGIARLLKQQSESTELHQSARDWFNERDWTRLSTRLLNIIDADANRALIDSN